MWVDEGARKVRGEEREKRERKGISCGRGGEGVGEGNEKVKRIELCKATGVKAGCGEGSGEMSRGMSVESSEAGKEKKERDVNGRSLNDKVGERISW